MAAMLIVGYAAAAFADASTNANCLAEANSSADPGRVGLDAQFYAATPISATISGRDRSS
jgi:hypothetical protein